MVRETSTVISHSKHFNESNACYFSHECSQPVLSNCSLMKQSDTEGAPEKPDLDNDTEADKTSKPAEILEGNDSANLAADGTVDSVSEDANNTVDSVGGGPDEVVDSDHVAANSNTVDSVGGGPDEIVDSDHVAANSAVEPEETKEALEETKEDVDMDASTKQASPTKLNQRIGDNADEGRIDLGGEDSGEDKCENTPSSKNQSSDEEAQSEESDENKSGAEEMKDADDDADDGDAAEGDKASSDSGREDESEERDEEENFVSRTVSFVRCTESSLTFVCRLYKCIVC